MATMRRQLAPEGCQQKASRGETQREKKSLFKPLIHLYLMSTYSLAFLVMYARRVPLFTYANMSWVSTICTQRDSNDTRHSEGPVPGGLG